MLFLQHAVQYRISVLELDIIGIIFNGYSDIVFFSVMAYSVIVESFVGL